MWLTEQVESCVVTETYALPKQGNLTLAKEKNFRKDSIVVLEI